MKLVQGVLRSVNVCLSHQSQWPVRAFSIGSNSGTDYNQSNNSFEPADDFERRIFGDISGSSATSNSFYQKLDRIQNARGRFDFASKFNVRNSSEPWDSLDETLNTLSDGMDEKLKKAATDFDIDVEEMEDEDFAFRPDMEFPRYGTYKTEDLDLTKPAVRRPFRGPEFDVTSEEVMKKADFRNVRFLANFITEAGIIIKRNKTKISAKAQRKVAREIKTARAFGLMPFTTMGTKHFVFGRTMEALDEDYAYDIYDAPNSVDMDANGNPVAE